MSGFRRLVLTAALAGGLSAVLLTLLQFAWVEPLIRTAETFERAAAGDGPALGHSHAAEPHDPTGPTSATPDWEPSPGVERRGLTFLANLVLATGEAMMIGAALTLLGSSGWLAGLRLGAIGFTVAVLAPSLGLPPAVPGLAEAALDGRQIWWLAAAAGAAIGIALLVLVRRPWAVALGLLVAAAPHLIGSPRGPTTGSDVPIEVVRTFITAVLATQLIHWLALGTLTGLLAARPLEGGRQSPRTA